MIGSNYLIHYSSQIPKFARIAMCLPSEDVFDESPEISNPKGQ